MRRLSIVTLLFAFALSSTLWAAEKPEPRYCGKPLASWVELLQKGETFKAQEEAAEALKAFGADCAPAVPELVRMLDDRSSRFRWLVTRVLCSMGPAAKAAVPELVRSLKDASAPEPEAVVRILGTIGPDAKDAVPVLSAAIDNKELRDHAVEALCRIGPAAKSALPAIQRAIRDAQTKDKDYSLVSWLSGLGEAAIPFLLELLDEEDITAQWYSLIALGKMGSLAKPAAPKVEVLLKHKEASLRRMAAEALWRIDHKNLAGVPVLVALLKGDAFVAVDAAKTLGEMGPDASAALPALKATLIRSKDGFPDDGFFEIHGVAEKAIGSIEGGERKK